MTSDNRKLWISLANVISSLAVVILHCNGVFWTFPSGRLWYTSNLIETLFYWPVPIFFMITGATLLDYRERYDTKTYFSKRFKRTVFPFLIWNAFASIFWFIFWKNEWGGIKDLISGFFTTKYCNVYWYFFPLFNIYLSIPLLSSVEKKHRIKVFSFITFIQIILVSILPIVFEILGITWNYDLSVGVASGYLLYVLLGFLISNIDFKHRDRILIYILGVIGFLLQFIGTSYLSIRDGQINQLWLGYFKIPEVFMSVAVFMACKYFKIRSDKSRRAIVFLSKHSFGVFLIHYYFVQSFPVFFHFNSASIIWRTIGAVSIYLFSSLIVSLLGKVKFLKSVVGE